MKMEQENKNSFTIGTAATGGALKVYLPDNEEEAIRLIKWAIMVYNTVIQADKLRNELR